MKSFLRIIRGGLCKKSSIIWSMILSFFGGIMVRVFAPNSEWCDPVIFFLVWILLLKMLHNPTLDKPEDLYCYKKVENKSFLDEEGFTEYLNEQGAEGWSLIAVKPSVARIETYTFMFKRKYYSRDKSAITAICEN